MLLHGGGRVRDANNANPALAQKLAEFLLTPNAQSAALEDWDAVNALRPEWNTRWNTTVER